MDKATFFVDGIFRTTERVLIVLLLANGIEPLEIKSVRGRWVEFSFEETEDLKGLLANWTKGVEQVVIYQNIIKAEDLFNTIIHNVRRNNNGKN